MLFRKQIRLFWSGIRSGGWLSSSWLSRCSSGIIWRPCVGCVWGRRLTNGRSYMAWYSLFFQFAYLNCCCFVPYCNIFIITLPLPYRKRERRQTWTASWTWHGFKIMVICEWMSCNLYKAHGSSSTCVSHQSQFECNKRCNGSCTSATRASLATLWSGTSYTLSNGYW